MCLNPTGRRSPSSKSGGHGTKEVYLTPGDPMDILHLYFVNQPVGEVQNKGNAGSYSRLRMTPLFYPFPNGPYMS